MMKEDHSRVQALISRMETEFDMEVLFACGYGSRIWGLENPFSDYDIRFIYKDPPKRAFSLYNERETISVEEICASENGQDIGIELVGWSLPKTLKLARASNAQILEFLHSTQLYRAEDRFLRDLEDCTGQFSLRRVANYYRGLGKKNYLGEMVDRPQIKIKPVLQAIRCLMMARSVVRNPGGAFPPLKFADLLETSMAHWSKYDQENVVPEIRDIVALKVQGSMTHIPQNYPALMNWCMDEIADLARDVSSLPDTTMPEEDVEKIYRAQYPEAFGKEDRHILEVL